MEDIIARIQEETKKDLGSAEQEWQVIIRLLPEDNKQRTGILAWIFAYHQGYVRTRVWAGQELMSVDSDSGWKIANQLISNPDPDDRDTAFMLFQSMDDPRIPSLVKPLLIDSWVYLQLDAAEFLKAAYPEEVKATLHALMEKDDQRIVAAARAILDSMKQE